jgi:hypothetical protein
MVDITDNHCNQHVGDINVDWQKKIGENFEFTNCSGAKCEMTILLSNYLTPNPRSNQVILDIPNTKIKRTKKITV